MSTPILSLSVLVLLCAAFPTQMFRFAGAGSTARSSTSASRIAWQFAFPAGMLLLAAWAYWLAPIDDSIWMSSSAWWFAVAAGLGVAVIAVEIGVGAGWAKLKRRPIAAVALHGRSADRSLLGIATVALVAVAEEVIFRGIFIWLLTEQLTWIAAAAIGLTAVIYGLNHVYYGWLTVVQKMVTGLFYGLLYVLSGYGVLVVIVAHVVQNVVVLTVLPRLGVRA